MGSSVAYCWERQPEAAAFVNEVLKSCSLKNPVISSLEEDLYKHTSTTLVDWLDHVIVGKSEEVEKKLHAAGFTQELAASRYRVFHHPGAQLPRVVVMDAPQEALGIAVKVESIADFLMVRGSAGVIEGSPFSGYRRCQISCDNGVSFWVVERRLHPGMEPAVQHTSFASRYIGCMEKWQTRPRDLDDEEEAMSQALRAAEEMVTELGQDLAAWCVLECERKFWQAKNSAGQAQKNRQDRLGMGWANHDHHTFRSSRKFFPQLVRLFEILGFHCRERFYAGQEAGWGAQVMENPRAGLVLFLDLDLAPDELQIDFAHQPLAEKKGLGTIGLWCALHGDSLLKAGMHHLEAQFDFEHLAEDLTHRGIGMMEPFSNFSYLKQAFTHGEVWPVDPKRIDRLLKDKKISSEEAEKFLHYGAVGSHMENLQRKEGYKGFNQKNVSVIIEKTDPRKLNA